MVAGGGGDVQWPTYLVRSCYIIRPVDHLNLKGHSYLSPSYAASSSSSR